MATKKATISVENFMKSIGVTKEEANRAAYGTRTVPASGGGTNKPKPWQAFLDALKPPEDAAENAFGATRAAQNRTETPTAWDKFVRDLNRTPGGEEGVVYHLDAAGRPVYKTYADGTVSTDVYHNGNEADERLKNFAEATAKRGASGYLNTAGYLLDEDESGQDAAADAFGAASIPNLRTGKNEAVQPMVQTPEAVRRARATASDWAYAKADQYSADAAAATERAKEGLGEVGQTLVDIGIAGTQMLGDVALNAVLPGAGLASMGVRSFGSATQEARQAGADMQQQFNYGMTRAAAEVLSEKLFDAAKLFGGGGADDVVERLVSKLAKTDAGRTVTRLLLSGVGEGAEEAVTDLVEPAIKGVFYDPVTMLATYGTPEGRRELAAQAAYDALISGVLGVAGGGIGIAKGVDAQKNATLRKQDNAQLFNAKLGVDDAGQVQRWSRKDAGRNGQADGAQLLADYIQRNSAESTAVNTNPAERKEDYIHQEHHGKILDGVRAHLSEVETMQPVSEISGNEFQKTDADGRNLRARITEFFNSLGNKVTRKGFGDIALNNASVRDSLGHGYGKLKAATFASLPDVLTDGKIISYDPNFEGRDYESYLIAAPVNVGGERCYVGAYVIKDVNMQRYKVHEVLTINKEGAQSFKTETPNDVESDYRDSAPFDVSISDFRGNSNPEVGRNALEVWARHHPPIDGAQLLAEYALRNAPVDGAQLLIDYALRNGTAGMAPVQGVAGTGRSLPHAGSGAPVDGVQLLVDYMERNGGNAGISHLVEAAQAEADAATSAQNSTANSLTEAVENGIVENKPLETNPHRQQSHARERSNGIEEYIHGTKSFDDVVDDYARIYADRVDSNELWSWYRSIPGGEKLTRRQHRKIKQWAVSKGYIPDVKVEKVNGQRYGFADFESAGVVKETVKLPESMWKLLDDDQFAWLDERIGGQVEGHTWHHTEIPGTMQLVPYGIHNITTHNGGRSAGMWADAPRRKNENSRRNDYSTASR